MFDRVKDHLEQVIDIADKCPEKYQVKCFEILLEALVKAEPAAAGAVAAVPTIGGKPSVKTQPAFLGSHGISEEEFTRVFDFDGTSYSVIVKDLREKTTAKKQVKLALLLGIKSLLESGQPTIGKDSLIAICTYYVAYNSPNFSSNMKKQKDLFLLKSDGWALTNTGQQRAAEVIKELAN